jgi:NUMOD3 motif-containing protein
MTPEQKAERAANISAATTAAMANPEVGKKISDALTGRKQSPERIQLMLDSVARSKAEHPERFEQTDAQRDWLVRLHEGNKGREHSPESRAKMSASQLKRYAKAREK